jgi:hypothetical protein
MAYGFGTTVNPQLGATNYSGYLQGALRGAEMQAQGNAAIGQGIMQGLQGFAQGVAQGRERKEKMAERDRLLKEQQDAAKGTIKQGNAFAQGVLALDLPDEVKAIFENYSKEVANNPNISIAEQAASAKAFLSQAPTIITLGLGEAKRQTDLQNNRFLQEAISMNTVAGTGEVDIPNAAITAVELGAAPDFVTQQLKGFEALTPKTQVTPTITAVPNPVTGGNVGVLQTGPSSFSPLPGLQVKSATETRIEAEALEDKRILDIQRTAIALEGDEQKKYLASLSLADRGAAKKAIRAYEGKGETAGLLQQILNPTDGSNSMEFRSKF